MCRQGPPPRLKNPLPASIDSERSENAAMAGKGCAAPESFRVWPTFYMNFFAMG